jgi:hypothetical protein
VGQTLQTSVVGSHYRVDLPNGSHNWRVTLSWQGIGGSNGNCDAGFIQYDNTFSKFLTQDMLVVKENEETMISSTFFSLSPISNLLRYLPYIEILM